MPDESHVEVGAEVGAQVDVMDVRNVTAVAYASEAKNASSASSVSSSDAIVVSVYGQVYSRLFGR